MPAADAPLPHAQRVRAPLIDAPLADVLAAASRVLVLRALGLGDLLTAVPALRALRAAAPRASLELAAPAWLASAVDLVGVVDVLHDVAPLDPLPPAAAGADVAVNLHGRGPQSTRLLLASRPGRLVAFAHPDVPETAGAPSHEPPGRATEHERERWCRLLTASGVPADARDLRLDPPPSPDPGVPAGTVVVHAGSASPTRRWPAERWATVARGLASADGPLNGARVVLTGSADERDALLRLAGDAGLPDECVLAGRTSLLQLAALVATARVVVSTDTGAAHLATALETPSVVLFGPVSPAEWGPPDGDRHVALWPGPPSDPTADGPAPALLATGAADVLAAVARLPRTSAGVFRAPDVRAE